VGNYCYVSVCSAAIAASAPTEEGDGRGHIVAAARLQLVNATAKSEAMHFKFCTQITVALLLLFDKKCTTLVGHVTLLKFWHPSISQEWIFALHDTQMDHGV